MSWSFAGFGRSYFREDDDDNLLEQGKENDGKIGLSNIGNTCYMNSALQCILHNVLLKKFFLNEKAENEINENNPLGTKGTLFKEFAKLFRRYYRTKDDRISPGSFKNVLGTNNCLFEGYQQHDSQEFWSYAIDMIHEDGNRIFSRKAQLHNHFY